MGHLRSTERLRILVSGRIAATPYQGGATWAVLQYLLGLRQLGHEVWFVEAITTAQLDPAGTTLARSANARYADRVLSDLDLGGRWALVREFTTETVGCDYQSLTATRWDVHINLSGCLNHPGFTGHIPVRIYV